MLCDNCELLVQRALDCGNPLLADPDFTDPIEIQNVEVSPQDVVSAANRGCYICKSALNSKFEPPDSHLNSYQSLFDTTDENGRLRREVHVGVDEHEGNIDISVQYKLGDTVRRPMDLCKVGIRTADARSENELPEESDMSNQTGDERVLWLARRWLTECIEQHEFCRTIQCAHAPARLIDIGLNAFGTTFVVVDTSSISPAPQYATLSHRWHEATPRLQHTTASKYRAKQAWAELTGAYQDAFRVTQHLGLRCIWIDSICIYQGDRLDMLSEGLMMLQIYSNAVCNISASQGRSDAVFVSHQPGYINTTHVLSQEPEIQRHCRIYLRDSQLWKREVEKAPLNSRGWVLQEQLLGTRTLYFGKTQMFWECGVGRRCESYPNFANFHEEGDEVGSLRRLENSEGPLPYSADHAIYSYVRQMQYLTLNAASRETITNLNPEILYDMWRTFVRAYSNRTISFSADKLIAIAGVSKLFAEVGNLTWVAGLWQEHMPTALWWHSVPIQARVDNLYRAPSWSWACVDGPVDLPILSSWNANRAVSQVLSIQCNTVHSDPFSLLNAGTLTLKATSVPLGFDRANEWLVVCPTDGLVITLTACADREDFAFQGLSLYYGDSGSLPQLDRANLEHLGPDFLGVVLHTYASEDEHSGPRLSMGGLILELVQPAVSGARAPRYRRAGWFNMLNCAGNDAFALLNWQPELFSVNDVETHATAPIHKAFDFNNVACLEEFELI